MISKENFSKWFQQFWTLTGASTKVHPAPYPLELALRLVQMFSFTGDTVLDPFCGTATTMVAALKTGRNSIGIELDTEYCRMSATRLLDENTSLFSRATLQIELHGQTNSTPAIPNRVALHEKSPLYRGAKARKKRKQS